MGDLLHRPHLLDFVVAGIRPADQTIFGDGGEFAQPACTTIGGGVYTAVCLANFELTVHPAVALVSGWSGDRAVEGDRERVERWLPAYCSSCLTAAACDQVEAFITACSVGKWPLTRIARR
jgi:hypothetical protein